MYYAPARLTRLSLRRLDAQHSAHVRHDPRVQRAARDGREEQRVGERELRDEKRSVLSRSARDKIYSAARVFFFSRRLFFSRRVLQGNQRGLR